MGLSILAPLYKGIGYIFPNQIAKRASFARFLTQKLVAEFPVVRKLSDLDSLGIV
jgi:hypothetical protein